MKDSIIIGGNMRAFARSDVGKVREINEDCYYISKPTDPLQLFIVADGMGGYNGGEIASKLAVKSATGYITNNFFNIEHDRENIMKLIKNAIEYANMIVYEKSNQSAELDGMGTTLDICIILGNRAYIGHIGDSRVYRLRKDFFRKLTIDHSYVQQLILDGKITSEEALNHPKKNMLTKALGCTPYVEPDLMVKGFLKNDIFLMCTDGLTNMLTDEQICNIIKTDPEKACKELITKANENGGYDNITVAIIL